jgi:hypothetical protein
MRGLHSTSRDYSEHKALALWLLLRRHSLFFRQLRRQGRDYRIISVVQGHLPDFIVNFEAKTHPRVRACVIWFPELRQTGKTA